MTFEELNLNKPLLNALNDLGYTTPTTIQRNVFSVVMSGRDVCGIAQTGTGKTFAYLLPMLRLHQFAKDRLPQMLILVPTRELVTQVVESIQKLSTYMNLTAVGVYGGVNMKPQQAELQAGADVVVGTPGRLFDLALNGSLKLKALKRVVIDEVDEMLNLGFRPQITRLFDLMPAKRQNLLFSATLTSEVEALLDTYFANPVRVEAAPAGTPLDNIAQTGYEVPNFNTKINLLQWLLKTYDEMTKVLVFVSTKQLADQLYERLSVLYPERVGVIHSNKAQQHRFTSVRQFHEGTYRVLIATDVIARGIDVAEVTHVINFDLPEQPESYIHRIGRTGRADRKGIAISLITAREEDEQAAIEALMNYQIPITPLPDDLDISDVLLPGEMEKVQMKMPKLKVARPEDGGGAFHDKIAKNKKVNVRRNHAEEMMKKYGRPIRKTKPNN